jgi:hypothetical protein
MQEHFDPFRAVSQKQNPWPPKILYDPFEKQPLEKPRPLVGSVLDTSSRMIFGGGSKTYKTWAMSDLALSLVVGAHWWGFETVAAPALYVNFELKPYYLQQRMKAIRSAKKLQCGPLWIWNLRGYEVPLIAFKEELLKTIPAHNILIVFIDPFYKLLGERDERLSAEINTIMAAFDEVNRLTGATVIFAAHFTKGNQAGKEAIDRISGGGSINRDPDNLVTLTKHDTEHAFTVDFTIRDFAPIQSFVVKWDYPLLVRTDLDPALLKKNAGRPEVCNPQYLYDLIAFGDDQFSTKELESKAIADLAWSRRTFYSKLELLKNQNRIFLSKLTSHWNIRTGRQQ